MIESKEKKMQISLYGPCIGLMKYTHSNMNHQSALKPKHCYG